MRVLVASPSKYGATAGIVEAIGRTLADAGLEVDIVPLEDVGELVGYDAFVLGSGVYVGQWLKSARRFVEAHAVEIAARPTWLFSSGPIGAPPKPGEGAAVKVEEIVALTKAREHRLFAGKLDQGRLRFADRAVTTAVRPAQGDYRDWEEITNWANDIARALAPSQAEANAESA